MTSYTMTRRHALGHGFLFLVVLWFCLLAAFHTMPELDIRISEFFFTGPICAPNAAGGFCGTFALDAKDTVRVARWVLYALPYIAAALVVIAIGVGLSTPYWRRQLPVRRLWLSLASLAIGPGLITNLWLKSHAGRPRPIQTDLFGGQMEFMPAGSFLGACTGNCSFISGEASGAGWLICLLVLVPSRYRGLIAPPVIIASVATAALRVAVGAHYASDAILGWLMSIVVFVGLLALEQEFVGHATADRW